MKRELRSGIGSIIGVLVMAFVVLTACQVPGGPAAADLAGDDDGATGAAGTGFTVTYDGNGEDDGSVPTDDSTYDADETVTVSDNTGGLSKSGYSFAGWNTAADGSGTDYAVGASFTITGDTTFYALWQSGSVTATGFTTTVAEGVANGTVLGTVAATAASGTPSFSMTFSNPVGAMSINDQGEVTVTDRGKFDYEANQTLEAAVLVSADDGTAQANVTIELEDVVLDGDQGLLAYYPFDGDYTDATINGYDGSPVGSLGWSADRDGTDNSAVNTVQGHVEVGVARNLPNGSSFTVAAWVLDDGSDDGYRTIVAKADPLVGGTELLFRLRRLASDGWADGSLAGLLYLGNNSYDFRNSGNSFPEEAWTHVALVYEANTGTGALAGSGTARLYQDGTEVASEEGVLFAVGDDTVTIGGRPSNQAETTENFSGSIDDVAFFSEALTGEQITALKDADGTVGMSAAETDLSVTYNGNGADVGSVPVDGNSYTAGDSVTVFGNTNGLSRPDYTFAGWNSRQDGSGDSYAADSTFSITQDVTLYAVWEPSGSGGDVPIGEVPIRVVPF